MPPIRYPWPWLKETDVHIDINGGVGGGGGQVSVTIGQSISIDLPEYWRHVPPPVQRQLGGEGWKAYLTYVDLSVGATP